ncbi:hypothetical protein HQ447_20970 [bacterium]|nr:hypothetical protein [bacterium]
MTQQAVKYLIEEMEEFLEEVYMKDVYMDLHPTAEQQDDEDWWNDVYIQTAVNSDEYNFEEKWEAHQDTSPYEVLLIVELINRITIWNEDENGKSEKWWGETLTLSKIYKMFAYMYVVRMGAEHWEQLSQNQDSWRLNDDDDVCVCEKETYCRSKDFPPNETDEQCPICLEDYDRDGGKLKDGIQNSNFESNCPHLCCCMCWDEMYKQNKDNYSCPICRRDITEWLKTHYDSDNDDDMCDCCVKGWDEPNKWGRCECVCSRGCGLLRDCKYKCLDKK